MGKKKNVIRKRRNVSHHPSLPEIGVYVAMRLKELRITNAEVANKTGWTKSAIGDMLKRNNWCALEMEEIGKILGENLHLLYLPKPTELMVPDSELKACVEGKIKAEQLAEKYKEDLKEMTAKYEGAMEVIEKLRK